MTPSLWTTWPRVCVALPGGRRLLGLVDRLAHAVAEAGALRDADLLDRSHDPIIARGPVRARSRAAVA